MNEFIETMKFVGLIVICMGGILLSILGLLTIANGVWSKWVDATRRTTWLLDYMRNRREYQKWKDRVNKDE
jgi:hypothetical protein